MSDHRTRRRFASRFDDADGDPMSVMGNLVDVMLVFACGLIAALIIQSPDMVRALQPETSEVERVKELTEMPAAAGKGGTGMESVGTVYRDPTSGKLILVDETPSPQIPSHAPNSPPNHQAGKVKR
ncbi:MAG: DUF2149 domain-containing protein [Myxococcota bacterium]